MLIRHSVGAFGGWATAGKLADGVLDGAGVLDDADGANDAGGLDGAGVLGDADPRGAFWEACGACHVPVATAAPTSTDAVTPAVAAYPPTSRVRRRLRPSAIARRTSTADGVRGSPSSELNIRRADSSSNCISSLLRDGRG
jgi:hypothetical protein